jgi:hypothetical protein
MEKTSAEAFSIRRLEGSRWRLRRTLAMGIEWRFGTRKAEDDLPSIEQKFGWIRTVMTTRSEEWLRRCLPEWSEK